MVRVAKALIYDPNGYALILRRSGTHPWYAHEADLPGGVVEHGESYPEGLKRELREEVGLEVELDAMELLHTGSGFDTRHLYAVHCAKQPKITISWEHDRATWVAPSDIATSLESKDPYMKFVRQYIAGEAGN